MRATVPSKPDRGWRIHFHVANPCSWRVSGCWLPVGSSVPPHVGLHRGCLSVPAVWRLACRWRKSRRPRRSCRTLLQPSLEHCVTSILPATQVSPAQCQRQEYLDARFSGRHLGSTTTPTRQARHRMESQHWGHAEGSAEPIAQTHHIL